MASLGAQTVKNLPAMQETQVQSLRWEDPLEKGMVTHSSILAWKIPWTQEPGRLQSIDSQRVRHDSVTNPFHFTFFSFFVAVVQSQSYVWLFVTAWTAACQTSLSFTISWSAQTHVRWVSVAVQPSHLLSPSPLPSVCLSIRVFSSESALCLRWPKYWSFSISLSNYLNIQGWFPLGLTSLILQSKGLWRVFFSPTVWKHQFIYP